MVDAKSLYKRHVKNCIEIIDGATTHQQLLSCILYAACIIAEAIKNELDETEIAVEKDDAK